MELNKYKELSELAEKSSKVYQIIEDKMFLEGYLDRFKIRPQATLFPLTAKEKATLLKDKRCLTCSHKLYKTRTGDYLCRSVKHKKGKFYKKDTIERYEAGVYK